MDDLDLLYSGLNETSIVNIKNSKYDIYIGRSGKGLTSIWGNPYSVAEYGSQAIPLYREYIYKRLCNEPELVEELRKLKGSRLGCFCKPSDCHGDILIEMIGIFIK